MIRKVSVVWDGNLRDGSGMIKLESGSMIGPFSYASRYEQSPGTHPEELIAAGHAGSFSMAFCAGLAEEAFDPEIIRTDAFVHLDKGDNGFRISKIDLVTEAKVPRIEEGRLQAIAEEAKRNCPVSMALSAVEVTLKAKLTKK